MVSLITGTPVFYDRTSSGSSFSFTVTKPVNAVTGDALIFVVVAYGANMPGIIAPAGWVRAYHDEDSWAGYSIYTHTVTAIDPSSWSFTSGGGAAGGAWLFGAHGQNPSGGFLGADVQALLGASAANNSDPTHLQVPNFTTARDNDLGIIAYGAIAIASNSSFPIANTETPAAAALPSGWTDAGSSSVNESHSGGKTLQINETGAATKVIGTAGAQSALDIGFADFLRWYGPLAGAVSVAFSILGPPPPTVLSVTSNSGPTGGGQTATIKGTLLTGTSAVTFGGTAATNVTVVDDETVTCTVPAHAAGAVTVAVTATAGSGSLASAYTYTAPAITGLSPARGSVGGGDTVTITGTNFAAVSGVTFGGTAATNVTLVNSTTITCTSPAHAAGAADVVVTDASTTTATIAGGYTYLSVIDKVVKLVKGGVVSGDNKADTVTAWPASLSDALYGGSTDLWGLTPTATEANGSDFGVVIQATLADGSKADIDYAEMTTYYTVTGLGDLPQLLCALTVNTDGQTTALDIYELPRGNLGLANDPNANRAVSDAWFYLSRILKPSRAIAKLWRELEFWLELLPTSNIPGFQVWAAADEGSFIQLRDGNGDAVTIRSEGAHRVFFPPDTTATGHYVQLKLGVPATAGSEQKVAVKVRDMVLRGVWQPISTERVDCTLVLSGDALIGGNPSARSVRQQEADLIAAQAQDAPVPFTDIDGTSGYGVITDLKFRTVKFKEGSESVRLATMTLWKLLYA